MGTIEVQRKVKKIKKYSEIRELETIRWAINDKIKNPVKGLNLLKNILE